jgi:hypothetical protein
MQMAAAAGQLSVNTLPDDQLATAQNLRFCEEANIVCDQSVDTLTKLLQLPPSFSTSAETIYNDEQINEIIQLTN